MIEERLDGTMAIRFKGHYLRYKEIMRHDQGAGADPTPESNSGEPVDGRSKIGTGHFERHPVPLACDRPAGARVALLRSPILG